MTNYEKKLRERAEEFAKSHIDRLSKAYLKIGVDFSPPSLEDTIPQCEEYARISLQREAEAYREAWRQSQCFTPEYSFIELEKQLQSLGLVPQK